jgi:hypothetical protein
VKKELAVLDWRIMAVIAVGKRTPATLKFASDTRRRRTWLLRPADDLTVFHDKVYFAQRVDVGF